MGQRMLKVQLEYALNQLGNAFNDKLPDRPEPYLEAPDRDETFIKLIESGKVNLGEVFIEAVKKYRRHPNCYNFTSVFSDELRRALEANKPEPKQNPEYAKWLKVYEKLAKLHRQAKDELMLGDAEHALKLIEKFRNAKVGKWE